MLLLAGQSLTSVKAKAGEALRLHRTSVGEEAQEEEEGAEEKTDPPEEVDPSGAEESTSADVPSRGVFSTISHAVQNTVRKHDHTKPEFDNLPDLVENSCSCEAAPNYKIDIRLKLIH